jgi:hypothetical protein
MGFTNHFSIQLVITLNYSPTADFHSLQITTAHAKSFPARSVFTSSCLVTASNNGYSSASWLKSSVNGGSLPTVPFLQGLPYRTDLVAQIVFLITPRHGLSRKHRFQQYLCCCMSIRCCGNVFTGPLSGNSSTRCNVMR